MAPTRGVHLEATGVNKWTLTGVAAIVHLEFDGAGNWQVVNGRVHGSYTTAGVALAHAYQLARGDSGQQALMY